jgi:hypothetical protein
VWKEKEKGEGEGEIRGVSGRGIEEQMSWETLREAKVEMWE